MKNLRIFTLLLFSVLLHSCSGDDDSGVGDPAPTFNATINGGDFNNYSAEPGSISATSTVGLTITVTDSNNNVIRIFLNSTGGFNSGVTKEIGNVDSDGFATNVTIRDQEAAITYTSNAGSISITGNSESPEDSNFRLISGNFDITASDNTGTTVTMTGNFSNIIY